MPKRLEIKKTYKLYVNGAFVRSESGRTIDVALGRERVEVPATSRKDARDAVRAARGAQTKWESRDPYNRGQILYRIAEMLEGRQREFLALGISNDEIAAAVDSLVHYAGWTDKAQTVLGSANAVSGSYLNFTSIQATGVVVAYSGSGLLRLVQRIAASIAVANAVIVVTSDSDIPVASTLGEVLACSDVPAGVVNLLGGGRTEVMATLAAHTDVNGLDVRDSDEVGELERLAAGSLKRVCRAKADASGAPVSRDEIAWQVEAKTLWHPSGR